MLWLECLLEMLPTVSFHCPTNLTLVAPSSVNPLA